MGANPPPPSASPTSPHHRSEQPPSPLHGAADATHPGSLRVTDPQLTMCPSTTPAPQAHQGPGSWATIKLGPHWEPLPPPLPRAPALCRHPLSMPGRVGSLGPRSPWGDGWALHGAPACPRDTVRGSKQRAGLPPGCIFQGEVVGPLSHPDLHH